MRRCYKPGNFGNVTKADVHHFSDTSEEGYSQCSILGLINEFGTIHCSFLVGKPEVSLTKYVTISRLELTATTLSVNIVCTPPFRWGVGGGGGVEPPTKFSKREDDSTLIFRGWLMRKRG